MTKCSCTAEVAYCWEYLSLIHSEEFNTSLTGLYFLGKMSVHLVLRLLRKDVLMKDTHTIKARRRFTGEERRLIYRDWRRGQTYAELARRHGTRRQNTRAVVLSFSPRLEDYRMHDYHLRERLFKDALRRRGNGRSKPQ